MSNALLDRTQPATAESFDRAYANRAMILLALMVVVTLYIEAMLTPSLPVIQSQFGVTTAQVSLVLALYLVSGTALAPVVGKLADIYGKKKVLVYVLGIYAAAVTVTGFSPTFEFMLAARTVQGIGLATMPLAMTLVREEFPRDMVPKAQGILSAMFGVGAAVALPLGALISQYFGWRATYHTAIPFVLALVILLAWQIRESRYRRPDARVDYFGAAGLGASLAFLVLGLSLGQIWGWTALGTLALLGVGGALLLPVALFERRTKEAILNFRLLSQRNVLVSNLLVFVGGGFAIFLAMFTLTYRLEYGFGWNILDTGVGFLPLMAGLTIFGVTTGILVSRTGVRPITLLGGGIGTVGFLTAAFSSTPAQLLTSEFVIGSGMAMMLGAVTNLLVLTVDPRDLGLGTSLNSVFRTMGSSVATPVAGTMLTLWTVAGNPYLPTQQAYEYVFLLGAVLFFGAALIVLFAHEVLGKNARPTNFDMAPSAPTAPLAAPIAETRASSVAARRGG